jgi:amidase
MPDAFSIQDWSAVRLLKAVADREVTIETVVGALINRVQALEPDVHAFAWFDRNAVMRVARALDKAGARNVLHGLPIAFKDCIDTAGIPTHYGSPIYAGHIPSTDAACVALARSSGAFVFGKTALAELANMTPCGTRNPINTFHTPGGSSSGSAAAVAAGMVPVAIGTQTAGSVIRPAAYCGVVGYKPSPRLIPRTGVKMNSDSLDELGVMARHVDDVGLVGGVLSLARPNPLPSSQAFAPLIGVTFTSRVDQVSPIMVDAIEKTTSFLATEGARVAQAAWPAAFETLFEAHRVIQWFETARSLTLEWDRHLKQLSPGLVALLHEARMIDGARYAAAIETARTGFAAIESIFAGRDVLVAPAASGEAPASLSSTGDPMFNRPWQLLRCPCITVPCGVGETAMPLGLQIIARPGDDARLLAAASWIEAALAKRG